jgi:hypothetical protein
MRRVLPAITLLFGAMLLAACADSPAPSAPDGAARLGPAADEEGPIRVKILDDCEPTSFNEALGPGTCIGDGETTFDRFLAVLAARHTIRTWRFDPRHLAVRPDWQLRLTNLGGEVHTFTEVEEFGGGIVPELNELAETPHVAPECLALAPEDFIPAGASILHEVDGEPGENEHYMCCIHPWMRMTLHVH